MLIVRLACSAFCRKRQASKNRVLNPVFLCARRQSGGRGSEVFDGDDVGVVGGGADAVALPRLKGDDAVGCHRRAFAVAADFRAAAQGNEDDGRTVLVGRDFVARAQAQLNDFFLGVAGEDAAQRAAVVQEQGLHGFRFGWGFRCGGVAAAFG